MPDQYRKTWDTYSESWKVTAEADKRALYKDSLDPDCCYTDPTIQTNGWDELVENMLGFHAQIPGGHFETTWFMAHNARSIAKWNMRAGDGSLVGEGVSYVEYNNDGKITTMNGFFDIAVGQ